MNTIKENYFSKTYFNVRVFEDPKSSRSKVFFFFRCKNDMLFYNTNTKHAPQSYVLKNRFDLPRTISNLKIT